MKQLWAAGILVLGLFWIGYANLHTDEPTVVLPFVLLVAAGPSLLRPRRAWCWALLAGLMVPASQAFAALLHLHVPYANTPGDIASACLVLIPASLAAAIGAGLGLALKVAPA
jgi:hypothetical protein